MSGSCLHHSTSKNFAIPYAAVINYHFFRSILLAKFGRAGNLKTRRNFSRRKRAGLIGKIVFRMNSVAGGINDLRRHKNRQILFLGKGGFTPEKAAEKRDIPQDGNFVFGFLDVFGH